MSARGEDGRGSFTRSTRSAAYASRAEGMEVGLATKIIRAGDEAAAQATTHHDKHRESWTTERYGKLLAKGDVERALTPDGSVVDPKSRAMARAGAAVAGKQAGRLQQIERAQDNMLQSGRVRDTRKVNWSKGLGE